LIELEEQRSSWLKGYNAQTKREHRIQLMTFFFNYIIWKHDLFENGTIIKWIIAVSKTVSLFEVSVRDDKIMKKERLYSFLRFP
jgi:hypothetical protein